jgi:hypothetical protein
VDIVIDLEPLVAKTDALLNTMYAVQEGFGLTLPEIKHVGTCINFIDLKEMRKQFIEELTNTVITYVYAPSRQTKLRDLLVAEGRDEAAAWRQLYKRARRKFRPSSLQSQFSELLLCNLLQHYYRAVPLVRKMSLTTNPKLERNGADAIHISRADDAYRLYIGEAKTYDRKHGGLKEALVDAIKDLIGKHYTNHETELDLYTYEDFVPPELEEIARQYRAGTLSNVEVHLVCIVAYDEKTDVVGSNRQEKLDCIMHTLREAIAQAAKAKAIVKIPQELLPRVNCIFFPVQKMDELIGAFKAELGA